MAAKNLEVVCGRLAVSAKRWAPLPLRLMVGFGFMAHGFANLSKGSDAFAAILSAMNVPMRARFR
jgi:putative oxidoreductase